MTKQEFKPEVSYEVTVVKKVTFLNSTKTSYERIGIVQEDDEYNKKGDAKYGYVTKPPFIDTKKTTVFQQTSDNTNILALIAAVNGVEFV